MSSALPTSITSSRQNILVLCLAFISGFIIMAIELLGGRILAPYFGSSIYVWGSIITVFMLSLSIGYLTGGRLSLHNPRLTLYGSFFATAAVLLFPLVFWGDAIMEAMFLRIEDPRYGSLVVSMLLFFLPTAVMGMIAPYSVRLLVMDHQHTELLQQVTHILIPPGCGPFAKLAAKLFVHLQTQLTC